MSDEAVTEPRTDPAPAPTLADVLDAIGELASHLHAIEATVNKGAEATVQLQNRVIGLHNSATKDAESVRSRVTTIEHHLGIATEQHHSGNGASAE